MLLLLSLPPPPLSLTHTLSLSLLYAHMPSIMTTYVILMLCTPQPPPHPPLIACVRRAFPLFTLIAFRIYCQFVRSRYNLEEDDPDYFIKAATSSDDWIGRRMSSSTPDGEPSFISAASLLPPSRDYAMVGSVDAHTKFSLSQDGRVRGPTLRKLHCTLALPPHTLVLLLALRHHHHLLDLDKT